MAWEKLPTVTLGRTGIEVTRLGYGTATEGKVSPDRWERVLNAVLDHGINFIDTSNDYGVGWNCPAEEMIGKYIACRRDEFYLATKCGCIPGGHVWTRQNIFRGLHESLDRLQMDYVDVMQLHNPTVEQCQEGELVRALNDMRDQGKVRWIGVSTSLPHLSTFLEWGVFDVFQLSYSAFDRDHEDWITQAARSGAGLIIRGGTTSGELSDGREDTDMRQRYEQAGLEGLRPASENRTTFILRGMLNHPDIHTVIVGTTNLDHMSQNVASVLRGPLAADTYDQINHRLGK